MTDNELKILLEAYNPKKEVNILAHPVEGQNSFPVDRIEICHHPEGAPSTVSIMLIAGKV